MLAAHLACICHKNLLKFSIVNFLAGVKYRLSFPYFSRELPSKYILLSMIENLKPFYNSVLNPVAKLFARLGLHPNTATLLGVALSLFAAYFCATGQWIVTALFVFLGSCMDGIDGLLARSANKKSVFGAVLDSTCDRITEVLWYIGILLYFTGRPVYGGAGIYLAFIAMSGSLMVSYIRARCEGEGIACKEGILQRPERIVVLIACFLLGPKAMVWGLGILSIFAYVTVVQRLIIAYRSGKKP
jgi:CDP-diacylglycerol--glycerol-3-phosphate 3-phosphatidyltransferase